MADINLPYIYPKGVISDSLRGIKDLSFGRNFGCSTDRLSVRPSLGEYKFALDVKRILSGLYFIQASTVDGESIRAVLSVDGKFSSYEGNEAYRNSVQLLSSTSNDSLAISNIEMKSSATTDIAVIVSIKSNKESKLDLDVVTTQIGSKNVITSTSDISQFNLNVPVTITGVDRSVIVKTDDELEVDLNSIDENSIVYCSPATVSSRPDEDGKGICSTFTGNGKRFQLFWSDNGKMFLRAQNFSWVEITASNKYPKVKTSGMLFVVSLETSETLIEVNGLDLTDERYSIVINPEYDINASNNMLQVSQRLNNGFKVKILNNWVGVISYSIVETVAPENSAKMKLTVGRLDGTDIRPATSVDEGQTLRFVLSTQNVPDDTLVQYTISGVSEYDIGVPLTGTFKVKNSSAYTDVTLLKDMLADGEKTIKMTIAGNISASMVVNDSSTAPVFDIIFSTDRYGVYPISTLKDGFVVYMIVRGISFDKNVKYTLDFNGSTAESTLIGSLPKTLDVTFDENNEFVYPFYFNQPDSTEQVVTISTDVTDLNLYETARTRLGSIKDPSHIVFVINAGVTVTSSSTVNSAITIGNFPQGSKLKIVNNGTIVGRGGRGGYAPSSLAQSLLDGESGGACFDGSPNAFCVIENYGSIYSGGGGGGASGVCTTGNSTKYHPIISGGGGAPFGQTLPIMGTSPLWMGDGYSDGLVEIDPTTNEETKQWLSFNGEVFYKIGTNAPVLSNIHSVGNATALAPATYSNIIFKPCSPGNGGLRGQDGHDGLVNDSTVRVVIAPGKGGKAGKVINQNEYNVLIKNYGLILGH